MFGYQYYVHSQAQDQQNFRKPSLQGESNPEEEKLFGIWSCHYQLTHILDHITDDTSTPEYLNTTLPIIEAPSQGRKHYHTI